MVTVMLVLVGVVDAVVHACYPDLVQHQVSQPFEERLGQDVRPAQEVREEARSAHQQTAQQGPPIRSGQSVVSQEQLSRAQSTSGQGGDESPVAASGPRGRGRTLSQGRRGGGEEGRREVSRYAIEALGRVT